MKIKRYLTAVVIILICIMSYCTYAGEPSDSIVMEEKNADNEFVFKTITENEKTSINLFSYINSDNAFDVKNVYTDENNNVMAVLYKCNYSYDIDGKIYINGKGYETEKPDSQGYVYKYFNKGEIVLNDSYAEIYFETGNETSDVILKNTIKICEGEEGLWLVTDDGHIITGYIGRDKNITVPNFYKGSIITEVRGYAGEERCYNILSTNDNIKSFENVNISEGIIVAGDYAFCEMSELENAELPESLEIIGGAVFSDTPLKGNIVIPENVREIYAYAFMNTDIESITFNEGLERLCSYAFDSCENLKGEILFPSSLYYMGTGIFYGCENITGSITIPGNVKKIGDGVFFNCSGLDGKLVIEEGVEEIGTLAFGADGTYKINFTSVSLPSTLRKIGPYAFQYCTKIKTITLPEGLEVISDGAFDHMSGLEDEKMVIPSTVHTIGGDYGVEENTGYGGHVFYDMGKNATFTAFEVANGNEYFKAVDGVLYSKYMTRMLAYPRGKRDEVFEMPEGVTQIDEMAFSRAYYLKKVILPDSYVIRADLPENILNQDANSLSGALYVYTSVKEIAVKDTNPNYAAVDGILYSKNMNSIYYIPNKYTGDVNIPEGVRKIEKGCMFAQNKANTNWDNIYIPSTMIYMDKNAVEFLNEYFKGYVIMEDSIYYETDSNNEIKEVPYTYGDVNMDGHIDNNDTALTLKYISGIPGNNILFNEKAADVNMDSYVDLIDAILNFSKYSE